VKILGLEFDFAEDLLHSIRIEVGRTPAAVLETFWRVG
jgi:hypothetical protein